MQNKKNDKTQTITPRKTCNPTNKDHRKREEEEKGRRYLDREQEIHLRHITMSAQTNKKRRRRARGKFDGCRD